MRDGQHEILAEGVEQAEGDVVVLVFAVDGVGGEILQHVVHPAHVPLHGEAEAVEVDRLGNAWKRGGLFGHGERAGNAVGQFVEAAQEVDGLQVFVAAELVGDPLAGLARIVQVEHGGDGIHAQAVDVILLQPEERVGDEEAAHLVAAVVEDEGAPVAVLAFCADRRARRGRCRRRRPGRGRPWESGRGPNRR